MNEPLFPPPADAASLYVGDVMHARLKPFGHRFTYRVFSMLLDLDHLEEAVRCKEAINRKVCGWGRRDGERSGGRPVRVGGGPSAGRCAALLWPHLASRGSHPPTDLTRLAACAWSEAAGLLTAGRTILPLLCCFLLCR